MLRRYPPRYRRGVSRPPDPVAPGVRAQVRARDRDCVFMRLGIPHDCFGQLELDHVRASGGLGLRSRSWRPVLLAWIERAAREAD
jgi:hypothetical protein